MFPTTSPSAPAPVSAYIPCYNNARTIALTIEGIRKQTHAVDELFVVDDGSRDNSVAVVEGLGVRVVRMGTNQGRGAARARAMELAQHEFVLCCDATNRLGPTFLENALRWFEYDHIASVQGRWHDANPTTMLDRWRARHLFQQAVAHRLDFGVDLSTHGTLIRKSLAMKVGNYDPKLRHGEDNDLSIRLAALADIVYDPALRVETLVHNTLSQLMERYSRWNRAGVKSYTMTDFFNSHVVTWRIMIPRDFAAGDWGAAFVSAVVPYYCFFHAENKSLTFPPRVRFKKPVPFHERKTESKLDS